VAAVVAMVVLFRKPLTDFAAWLWEWGKPISSFWAGLWNGLVNVVNTAATTIKSVFTGVGTAIKAVLNGVLRGVFGAVNGAIANINGLINRANALSARVKGPQLPTLPTLSVPQFAQGGVVTGPTLAMVGEGGEAEYIIPASKMAAASANYLNGAQRWCCDSCLCQWWLCGRQRPDQRHHRPCDAAGRATVRHHG
jgi:hypothetical protein